MDYQDNLKIFLDNEILEKMIKCVKKAYPNEACGLIFGDIIKVDDLIEYEIHYVGKKFNCFESDRKSPVAFLIDNFEELNSIFLEASQKHELKLISIFHSHPAGAYPSGTDKNHMLFLDDCVNRAFKNQIWTIMDASNEELNGFIYFNKEFKRVEVKIK